MKDFLELLCINVSGEATSASLNGGSVLLLFLFLNSEGLTPTHTSCSIGKKGQAVSLSSNVCTFTSDFPRTVAASVHVYTAITWYALCLCRCRKCGKITMIFEESKTKPPKKVLEVVPFETGGGWILLPAFLGPERDEEERRNANIELPLELIPGTSPDLVTFTFIIKSFHPAPAAWCTYAM